MSVKIFDTMTTATPNFPLAYAEKINVKLQDGTEDNLQNLFDNGELIGGGGDSSVTLTQQEYEALSEEQKLGGLYYTYDTKRIYKNGVQYGASDAEDIGYNNAVSNLPCTTVQGAIDKVNANLGELIKTKVISGTSSTNGNYNLELSGDKYVVLSANYVGIADNTIQVLPYLSNGNTWWATCIGINEEDVVHRYKNTDFTVRVTYIELP